MVVGVVVLNVKSLCCRSLFCRGIVFCFLVVMIVITMIFVLQKYCMRTWGMVGYVGAPQMSLDLRPGKKRSASPFRECAALIPQCA